MPITYDKDATRHGIPVELTWFAKYGAIDPNATEDRDKEVLHYAADGYLYRKGPRGKRTKVRKWLAARDFREYERALMYWAPDLDSVLWIESTRWEAVLANRAAGKAMAALSKAARETGEEVYVPLSRPGRFEDSATHEIYGNWRENDHFAGWSRTCEYLYPGQKPKHQRHMELGEAIAQADKACADAAFQCFAWRRILEEREKTFLPSPKLRSAGQQLRVEFNGRFYWYAIHMGKFGQAWKELAWPEDDVEYLVFKEEPK